MRLIMNIGNIVEAKSKSWLTLAQIKTLLLMGCIEPNPGPIGEELSNQEDEPM